RCAVYNNHFIIAHGGCVDDVVFFINVMPRNRTSEVAVEFQELVGLGIDDPQATAAHAAGIHQITAFVYADFTGGTAFGIGCDVRLFAGSQVNSGHNTGSAI